jgi:hypothetical protein
MGLTRSVVAGLVVLCVGLVVSGQPQTVAHGQPVEKKHCHKVKRHGKKVRVCTNVKPTATNTPIPTATSTPTPLPTDTPTPTATATKSTFALDPAAFALSASDFSADTTVTLSQVESNAAADADKALLHFGPLSRDQQGRLTGYVMETGQANRDAAGTAHVTLIDYLVSIFSTPQQAQAAVSQQAQGWAAVDSNSSCRGNPGDPGSNCVGATGSAQIVAVETYEARGRVLIEVWGVIAVDDVNADDYLTTLSARVVHVLGALQQRADMLQGLPTSLTQVIEPLLTRDTMRAERWPSERVAWLRTYLRQDLHQFGARLHVHAVRAGSAHISE